MFWSAALPDGFKRFAAKVSIDTSAIQYENDELMRPQFGDDTAIACCVSAMPVGKQMQFFGARVNLAKTLLYAINGGRDEVNGKQVGPVGEPVSRRRPRLRRRHGPARRFHDGVAGQDLRQRAQLSSTTCTTSTPTSGWRWRCTTTLRDRTLACGIAGLSVAADSLSAIKYATVRPVRDETGLVVDYEIEGEFPTLRQQRRPGRLDRRAELVETFMEKVRHYPALPRTPSTPSRCSPSRSNVVYGKHTGNTPDGRRAGEPFAPGANPMHGRDHKGLVAAALSVAKLPYDDAEDGISLTASVLPGTLGKSAEERIDVLVGILDGYMVSDGFHMNVNVLNRETLLDAMEQPGEVPAADHPGVRVRRELRAAHARAAARRHQPHLPHELVMPDYRLREGTGVAATAGAPRSQRRYLEAVDDGSVTGFIHSSETTGTVNGPGVRYTLYMSGCPLRCLYCHNPDTWEMRMGERVTVGQVVDDIEEYLVFLRTTHGGLTTQRR